MKSGITLWFLRDRQLSPTYRVGNFVLHHPAKYRGFVSILSSPKEGGGFGRVKEIIKTVFLTFASSSRR